MLHLVKIRQKPAENITEPANAVSGVPLTGCGAIFVLTTGNSTGSHRNSWNQTGRSVVYSTLAFFGLLSLRHYQESGYV